MKKYIKSNDWFDDGGFFTRDDCIEYLENPLSDEIKDKFGIDVALRSYIEDGNQLDVDVETSDGYEFNIKLDKPIDMRKIRLPRDLQKYVPELLHEFEEQYDGNGAANFYYQLMNKLDEWALSGYFPGKTQKQELDNLLAKADATIEDIADANDCGECHTWEDIISALHILFEHGERG